MVECTIASGLSHVVGSNTVNFLIPVTAEVTVKGTTVANTASVRGGGDPVCAIAGTCTSVTVNTPVTSPELEVVKSGSAWRSGNRPSPWDPTPTMPPQPIMRVDSAGRKSTSSRSLC